MSIFEAVPSPERSPRSPRKSILKTQKRPVLPMRSLSHNITDRFPLELFRIIIDWLHLDKVALSACSLVCRAWLPLCRCHVYSRMSVHPENASRYLSIVQSPYITIESNVRHLTIQKQLGVVDHFFIVNNPVSPLASATLPTLVKSEFKLAHILRQSKSLTFITKLSLYKGYGENSEIALQLKAFPYLEDLELRSCEFMRFSDLAAVISAQPDLLRLSLTDIAWGIRGASSPIEDYQLSPRLLRLSVFMENQAELFNWILAKSRAPKVEYVELGGITELDDAIAVGRFLRGLGPVLKHLRLYTPNRINQVNLVHNTGLQSLYISHLQMANNQCREKQDRSPPPDEVCIILSQLCSPGLTRISLQLMPHDAETLTGIDWQKVARTLSLPRFRNLKTFEFRIPRWRRWMSALIAKNLPDMTARGILSVANG